MSAFVIAYPGRLLDYSSGPRVRGMHAILQFLQSQVWLHNVYARESENLTGLREMSGNLIAELFLTKLSQD
jgi:hypothetical protein